MKILKKPKNIEKTLSSLDNPRNSRTSLKLDTEAVNLRLSCVPHWKKNASFMIKCVLTSKCIQFT